MRGPFRIFLALVLIVAGVGIGISAYNWGYTNGLEAGGADVQVVRTVGHGWGFFPGFFIFPLVFILLFAFARGRHGWHHGGRHDEHGRSHLEQRFDEWHAGRHQANPGT